jgi:UDP-glucuronate 4-epimerase
MRILITGGAGFIGYNTAKYYLEKGHDVCIIDDFNSILYDSKIKFDRIKHIRGVKQEYMSLCDRRGLKRAFIKFQPELVIHLAAMAGVRFSMDNDKLYIENNIVATQNVIDCCEKFDVENVIYASTSCVMGGNPVPWNEEVPIHKPLSPYGYTKITNESQFHISHIPNAVGLRFFTVYGPWGRPDMALFDFTKSILANEPIQIFNHGKMIRDFTYIDDIIQGIDCVVRNMTERDIYCIGYGREVELLYFVEQIEKNLGKVAEKRYVDKHPADVPHTFSDTTKLQKLGYNPTTSIETGVENFINWYMEYYKCG